MSRQLAWDVINLRPTERLAHTEYCSNSKLIEALRRRSGQAERCDNDLLNMDLFWVTDDGPVAWGKRGRVTDMGHAEFMEGGVDFRAPKPSPFSTIEDVWAFDAVREYGLPDFQTLVAYYRALHEKHEREFPNQLAPGGYYKTLVSGAIESFGWDMLLLAASEPDAFEKVLDSFFRLTLHHVKAWAETGIHVYISHDDMVWSEGAFLHPDFYRRVIFPRYRELWAVLKARGIKVLFCSDANYLEFLDDIAEAGADGFIFEPMMPLDTVVERYGRTHVIVGSKVDCRTLTSGTPDRIRAEVDATLELARSCPGFIVAVGNHIPSNVPVENGLFYLDYLTTHWNR